MGKFMYKFVNVFNNDWKIMQEFKGIHLSGGYLYFAFS